MCLFLLTILLTFVISLFTHNINEIKIYSKIHSLEPSPAVTNFP